MKLSRTLSAVVAAVALLTLLVGCGSSKKSDSSKATDKAAATSTSAPESTTSAPDTTTTTATAPATTAPTAPGGQTAKLSIKGFAFNPESLKIKVGTTVTFVNDDGEYHTVTSDPGAPAVFDSGKIDPGGAKSYTFTFAKAGTYKYHCNIHVQMTGTIEVS